MVGRSIGLHVFLFVGSAVLALRAWTSEDGPQEKHVAAELWSARPNALERIEFETPKNKVSLEPKQDQVGRYFVGTVQPVEQAPPEKPTLGADAGAPPLKADPHSGHESESEDSEAQSGSGGPELSGRHSRAGARRRRPAGGRRSPRAR